MKLRHDAASRAISGASSGGICAFTVAWERPDEFSKVLSWVGSFTNIASGKTLREGRPQLRGADPQDAAKPIRVFLQDGANDLDNANGNWPLANQQMAKSLAFAGYDYKFEYGQGFHSNRHGRAILPDSLRWLWRDYHTVNLPPKGGSSLFRRKLITRRLVTRSSDAARRGGPSLLSRSAFAGPPDRPRSSSRPA